MPYNATTTDSLLAFLATGVYSSTEICRRLRISQSTFSRMVARSGIQIFSFGQSRRRRYTRRRVLEGVHGDVPVFRIDRNGDAQRTGTLITVGQRELLWQPVSGLEQLFSGIPWFLADMYPEGFMGRAFVRRIHLELGYPARIEDCNDDCVLSALARRGEDFTGNIVIGDESLERYVAGTRLQREPIREPAIAGVYSQMTLEALSGQPPGSSAGGEQPKFTAVVERDDTARQVIVKFSPPMSTAEGSRWADLLRCENHALQVINETAGVCATESRIVTDADRVYLEVERFDRIGSSGRIPVISLRAINSELLGQTGSWIEAAEVLRSEALLTDSDAAGMRWLSVFGQLIADNDQHFGNLSFYETQQEGRYTLAPAYDMLPMLYRPLNGETPTPSFTPPAAAPGAPAQWPSAVDSAVSFWDRAAADTAISDEFRHICRENSEKVRCLRSGPRILV